MGRSVDQPESQIQCADKKVLDWGLNAFSWIKAQDAFVTSFSKQGNILSQWRAYSGENGGYSVGFTRSYLKSVGLHFLEIRKESFYEDSNPLVACRYCDNPEEKSLKRKIGQIVDSYIAEANQTKWQTNFEMKEKLVAKNCWSCFLNAFLLQYSNHFERRIMKAVLSAFQDFRIFQQQMHILEICSKNLYRIIWTVA